MSPDDHYRLAMLQIDTILEHRDSDAFDNDNAQTLCMAAIAHSLLGLLRLDLDHQEQSREL